MACLSYVDLMIIQNQLFLTICHHITDTCICILPPLNFVTCVRCIWSLKSGQQVPVPGPPSSRSSENSTMAEWSFPVLFSLPIPLFVDDVELDHLLPLLVLVQLLHLPPLCPLLPAIPIWNKNFKSPNNLKLDQVMFIKRDSPHVLASFLLRNSDDVWFERPPLPPRPTL